MSDLKTVEELNGRLDDAWAAKGDYAEDDVDVLRALAGEALQMGKDFALLLAFLNKQGQAVKEKGQK